MNLLPLISIFTVLVASPEVAFGDTVFLKDGTKVEGQVIRENEDAYTLEVQVTKTIKDERIIAKKDVKRVDRASPDTIAFEELEKLIPAPDLLTESEYESRIAEIRAFQVEFPESGKLEAAGEMLEALGEELSIVAQGGIKLGGKLITSEDYQANAYEYDALVKAAHLDEAMRERNFIEAIREFASYDETFKFAQGREELANKMIPVLRAYQSRLEESLAEYAARIEDREKGLAQMAPEDRMATLRAIDEKAALIEAQYQKEKSEGLKLVTPFALHQESLREAIRQVEGELRRVEEGLKDQAPEIALEAAYRDAWQQLPTAADAKQEEILSQLTSLMMPESYLQILRKRAAQAVESAVTESEPEMEVTESEPEIEAAENEPAVEVTEEEQ